MRPGFCPRVYVDKKLIGLRTFIDVFGIVLKSEGMTPVKVNSLEDELCKVIEGVTGSDLEHPVGLRANSNFKGEIVFFMGGLPKGCVSHSIHSLFQEKTLRELKMQPGRLWPRCFVELCGVGS